MMKEKPTRRSYGGNVMEGKEGFQVRQRLDGRLADLEVMIRALRWGLAWLSSAVRVAML